MMPDIIADTFDYLLSLDEYGAFRVFWYFFIFDFPRYVLTDIFILIDEKLKERSPRRDNDFLLRLKYNPPLVTVIIPALNEEETIGWTVRSLQEQTYKNLQLIIVDDGSTDGTPEICHKLAQNDNIIYARFSERAGKSAVLNYGLQFTRGEFVIFVDSDTTFDRDAIYKMLTAFADPEVGGVSGNLRPRNGNNNLLTHLQQIEYIFTISIGRRVRAKLGILPIISGAFGGFRRNLIGLNSIGGHEPGPGNDSDLAIRVRKKGYKISFQPDAICLTNVPANIRALINQRSRWDRNMIKNRMRKHRDIFNPYSKNFRLIDVITFVDSLFYHVALSFVTAVYLFDIAVNFTDILLPLLVVNFCLYFCAELLELLVAIALSNRTEDFKLLLYLPLINPFKIFLKFVRLKAYFQELVFRHSNVDPFAPYKVRQRYIQW